MPNKIDNQTFESGVNPFEGARQIAEQNQLQQQSVVGFEFPNNEVIGIGAAQPETPQNSLQDVLVRQSQGDIDKLEVSGLNKRLQTAGLSIGNRLTFDDAGRKLLLDSLKEKFGDNFRSNSAAVGILSDFEKELNGGAEEEEKRLKKSVTSGDRTLAALFGGQV